MHVESSEWASEARSVIWTVALLLPSHINPSFAFDPCLNVESAEEEVKQMTLHPGQHVQKARRYVVGVATTGMEIVTARGGLTALLCSRARPGRGARPCMKSAWLCATNRCLLCYLAAAMCTCDGGGGVFSDSVAGTVWGGGVCVCGYGWVSWTMFGKLEGAR